MYRNDIRQAKVKVIISHKCLICYDTRIPAGMSWPTCISRHLSYLNMQISNDDGHMMLNVFVSKSLVSVVHVTVSLY